LLSTLSREIYDSENSQELVESGENVRDLIELSVENVSYFDQRRFIANLVLRYQTINDEVSSVTDSLGTVTAASDKTYNLFNPQLGLKYRFNQGAYLTANIGKYNRAPSFFELFGGDGLLLGNTDLE